MESLNINSTHTLSNGKKMPVIGLGCWKVQDGQEVQNAVKWALNAGYRLIDTAIMYQNEAGVGKAVRESGVPREEIFVTTKLWNDDQGYESAHRAFEASLDRLGLDYLDLYLIHWPFKNYDAKTNERKESWRALEEIYQSGKVKAIGVSNFTIKHLEEMKTYAKVMPMVNQFELHPFLYQKEMVDYCQANGIVVEAYSPLSRANKIENQILIDIGKKYQKTAAQIMLRWSLQKGAVPIPKSVHEQRIQQNIDIFDFHLSPQDTQAIDQLNQNLRNTTWDPNTIP